LGDYFWLDKWVQVWYNISVPREGTREIKVKFKTIKQKGIDTMNISTISIDLKAEIVPAEVLAKMKGIETTAMREKRIKQEYEAMLKKWEEKLRTDINISLFTDGVYSTTVFSDELFFSRADIVRICDRIVKDCEKKGYIVYYHEYAESNRSKVYNLRIEL
jgi:hypothetical protein